MILNYLKPDAIKKKSSGIQSHAGGIGGGPPMKSLTAFEERMSALIGQEAVAGLDVDEGGFGVDADEHTRPVEPLGGENEEENEGELIFIERAEELMLASSRESTPDSEGEPTPRKRRRATPKKLARPDAIAKFVEQQTQELKVTLQNIQQL